MSLADENTSPERPTHTQGLDGWHVVWRYLSGEGFNS